MGVGLAGRATLGMLGGVNAGGRNEETSSGRRGPCPECGTVMSVANMAQHVKT